MAFTVTVRAGDGSGAVEDRYGDDAHFTVHDSGALFVNRSDGDVVYAPGVWFRVDEVSAADDDSAMGNYI